MGRRMDFSRPNDEGREGQDSTGGADSAAPGRLEIEAALDRILASKAFASAPRQQALLRHIVIETIEGRGDRLKEFSLAVDVFGRSSTFDPRLDSIVRVQASRLRTQLADYFTGDGAAETVRIEVPAGGYVAAFTRPITGVAAPARSRRHLRGLSRTTRSPSRRSKKHGPRRSRNAPCPPRSPESHGCFRSCWARPASRSCFLSTSRSATSARPPTSRRWSAPPAHPSSSRNTS